MISPHLNTMLARTKVTGLEDPQMSAEAMAEVDRIIARGVERTIAAARTAVIEATLRPGMTEHEAAQWAAAASRIVPTVTRRVALALEAPLRTAIEPEACS